MASAPEQQMISSILESVGSTIPSATDFPTNKTEAAEQVSRLNNIINKGSIDESTVDSTFPGFKPVNYQGEIDTTGSFFTYTTSPWVNQNELTFNIKPPLNGQIISSTTQLIMPISFTESDGTVIPKVAYPKGANAKQILGSFPVNNFWVFLFKQLIIKKNGAQLSKIQEYSALESMLEMETTGDNRISMSNDLLFSKERTYPGVTRRPYGTIGADDSRVTPSYQDRLNRLTSKIENITDAVYIVDLQYFF